MTLLNAITANTPLALSLGGLAVGFAFGVITARTNFCAMGSLSDIVAFGDWRRFRAWLVAIAVSLLGAQGLQLSGFVDLERSMYLTPSLNWFGHILGGLMFGFGMVFAGGCASRNLVRAGGGDLRSLFTVIVIGIFAFMTIGGVLGPARAAMEQATRIDFSGSVRTQGLGEVLAAVSGASPVAATMVTVAVLAAGLLIFCFSSADFRSSPLHIFSGFGIGVVIVAGWALTGMTFDEMDAKPQPPVSLTYVRPTGDALEWLQRFTALGWPGFGVATVFGALLGGFAAAKAMGRFRLTTFADPRDTLRSLTGAALMGAGGVMALGCTIGQGITGVSTLAVGSFLTLSAIVTGGVAGLKALERLLHAEA